MTHQIFDLNEISDLSPGCKNQLKLVKTLDELECVLDLFVLKNELTINEILVGLYRQYNLEKSRFWVSGTLQRLKRKKLIASNRGIYTRIYEVR